MDLIINEGQRLTGCRTCGGTLAEVRGRYPGTPSRTVCPTCMLETLEDLLSSRSAFGVTEQASKDA
jgi:hypothetical protein